MITFALYTVAAWLAYHIIFHGRHSGQLTNPNDFE